MYSIINGDVCESIKSLDKKSVQMCMTSPPYYNLRNYTDDIREIGTEISIDKYLTNLIKVFDSVKEVLKDDGVLFVNIGDVYDKKGSLSCVPDKFKILMVTAGWICRNEIIWHKPNAIPSSAKNRFTNDYEKVYMFTKRKKYKFFTQYEDRITKPSKSSIVNTKYDSINQESSVRQGMNKDRGKKEIEKRNYLPEQKKFVDFIRSVSSSNKLYSNVESLGIKKSTIDHWFRYDDIGFSYPKVEDWIKVRDFLNDWSVEYDEIDHGLTYIEYETDDINKNSDKGRIKRTVWSINTRASKIKHFASYPEELVTTPILATTSEKDIVLDPFMGSGTTGVVSKKLNRRFIGIDINKNYCEYAKDRIDSI